MLPKGALRAAKICVAIKVAPACATHRFAVSRYHTEIGMLRFETAGESHGECLVATLTGLPAGIPISLDYLNRQLWRRQQGFGRGGRMKIETDRVHIVSGIRYSQTIGSPIAILLANQDWKNWADTLPVEAPVGSWRRGRKRQPVRGRRSATGRSAGRVPAMPTWRAPSSTTCLKPATFWSAPAPAKRLPALPLERWPRRF